MTNGSHIREEDLELNALGALPEEEAAAAQAHVAGCDDCARKLAEARGRAAMLAFAATPERPPASAKEKLFARIAAERGTERIGVWEAGERRAGREERKTLTPWWNWVVMPAALALAAVSLLLSWQNRKLGSELRKARETATEFRRGKQQAEDLVRLLAAPDTITVKLAGTGDAAQAQGVVKYNKRLGAVLYTVQQLPTLPPEKIYQMWLVPDNGAPISAGVFAPGTNGNLWTAQVPANTESKAFAVTIEPAGGVEKPTGPKVLLGAS